MSDDADGVPAGQVGFDLDGRTAKFGEEIIRFCRNLQSNAITEPLMRQLVRSGTSVGANYCEADESVSRREFRQKIGTCKKEARETKYWLRMLAAAEPSQADTARVLWKEAKELHLIFASIYRKLSPKKRPRPRQPSQSEPSPSPTEVRHT